MTSPNLFQFWNTKAPPQEVATLMEGWKADTGFTYRRFDAEAADAYIEAHFGAQVIAAFRTCAVPDMQADLFRYCALYQEGGVYVDATCENAGGLAALIADTGRGMLMMRQTRIANDVLFVRAPRDPLFETVIARAVANIEARDARVVWAVTGPGIMTGMYDTPQERPWFDGFRIRPASEVGQVVRFHHDLSARRAASSGAAAAATGTAPSAAAVSHPSDPSPERPQISIVVLGYRMRRELPRTILSMSPSYQNMAPHQYEIALSEMPSDAMLTEADRAAFPANLTYTAEPQNIPLSEAMNRAVRRTRGTHLLLCVDGARILSPGILQRCRQAIGMDPRGVLAVHGMHLGARPQQVAVPEGTHSAEIEDGLLADIEFPRRPYQLFDIACWAGSSRTGWFGPMAESCALMVSREHFEALGGFDEKVRLPGGGLANCDLYTRATSGNRPLFVALGEATFHQHHGGTTTSAKVPGAFEALKESFKAETGRPFVLAPGRHTVYLGSLPRQTVPLALGSLIASLRSMEANRPVAGVEGLARIEARAAAPAPESAPEAGAQGGAAGTSGAGRTAPRVPLTLIVGMHRSGTSFLARQMVRHGFVVPGTPLGGNARSNPEGHHEPMELLAWHNRLLADMNLSWSALGRFDPQWWGEDFLDRHARALQRLLLGLEAGMEAAGTGAAGGAPAGAAGEGNPGQPREAPAPATPSDPPGWVLKDPRMCLTRVIWQRAFALMEIDPAHLLILRDPTLVAESLRRRNRFELDFARLLWARHVQGMLPLAGTADDLLCLDEADAAAVDAYVARRTGRTDFACDPVMAAALPPARDPLTRLYRAFLAERDLEALRTGIDAELAFLDQHPGLVARLDRLAGLPD